MLKSWLIGWVHTQRDTLTNYQQELKIGLQNHTTIRIDKLYLYMRPKADGHPAQSILQKCRTEQVHLQVPTWYRGRKKVDKSSPKRRSTCYTHQCPLSCHRAGSNGVREKHYNFKRFSLFWRHRGPWAKVHYSGWWCIARPPLSICHQIFPSDNTVYEISSAKFRRFRGRSDSDRQQRNKKKQTPNDIASSLPCGD